MIQLKYPRFWSSVNCVSWLLTPFSYIYRFLGLFRQKFAKRIKLPQKVICIGNITVGGTGKTQLVGWLADVLKAQDISFVIITKAYRASLIGAVLVEEHHKAEEVGDESIILKKFGPVIAAKKIIEAVKIIEQLNPQIVILDDGMQNPTIHKDFNILVFDSISAIGNNKIFPAGPLRESLDSGLRKAAQIFMIGNQDCDDLNLVNNIHLSKKPFFRAKIKLLEVVDISVPYIAFAGIGNPEKFYSLLKQYGVEIKHKVSFEDHHNYSDSDLKKLLDLAKLMNCHLITTEKDYVKLSDNYKKLIVCAKVEIEVENEQEVISFVNEALL